jgi:hypothetical protein
MKKVIDLSFFSGIGVIILREIDRLRSPAPQRRRPFR